MDSTTKILAGPWTTADMADQVIARLNPGSSLNLGIGLPTLIAERMPVSMAIMIQSENGVLGVSGRPLRETVSATLINAGKETIAVGPGCSYFDSALSFGMIRGGHIDACVLGGMEVDVQGNLANWMVPGKKVTGMGGAMDLVHGAKCVIVMMTHFSKSGSPKLLQRCALPLTGVGVVNLVVTDFGIFRPTGNHFVIEELAPGITANQLGIDALIAPPEMRQL